MTTFKERAEDFMAQKRIAIVGASDNPNSTGLGIFKSLRDQGYDVVPVNPNAETVQGMTCYASLKTLPEPVGGAVIVTRPEVTEQVVRDCVEAGVPRVWMHYNPMFGKGNSSASDTAVTYAREHGLTVLEGGCPLMFVDFPHKCMRWILGAFNRLPH